MILEHITISESDSLFFKRDFFEKHIVILYGAGQYGQQVAELLRKRRCKVFAFCDNNKEKVGQELAGLPILHPTELDVIENLAVFITARHQVRPIEMSLKKENIQCIPFDKYIVVKDMAAYERAYSLLSDDYSKKTFSAVLNTMVTGDTSHLLEVLEDHEFFCLPEFQMTENATFLDAGAYVGDTLEKFIWNCGGIFNKAFCFEPSIKPFQAMQKRVKRLNEEWNLDEGQISCINAGIGEYNGHLKFQYITNQPQTSAFVEESTNSIVAQMYTLDEFISQNDIHFDFIKMDIEGYEMRMLRGAKETIQRDKPKLAVSVYHTPEHLYEVITYLTDLVEAYRFSLRQHSNSLVATTLYVYL